GCSFFRIRPRLISVATEIRYPFVDRSFGLFRHDTIPMKHHFGQQQTSLASERFRHGKFSQPAPERAAKIASFLSRVQTRLREQWTRTASRVRPSRPKAR